MKIIPIGKRVLLRTVEKSQQTSGGIYIPSTDEKQNIGDVIAVGESNLKVGNRVVYSKFSGTEISNGSEKYIIVEDKDILGIIEEA